jgi:hypothetical protein
VNIGLSGRILGAGKQAEVFDRWPLILKLYRRRDAKDAAFREAAILSMVESFNLRSPKVAGLEQVDGRWGVLMTRADGLAFAEAMSNSPGSIPSYLASMAALHAQIHLHEATQFAGMKASSTPISSGRRHSTMRDGCACANDLWHCRKATVCVTVISILGTFLGLRPTRRSSIGSTQAAAIRQQMSAAPMFSCVLMCPISLPTMSMLTQVRSVCLAKGSPLGCR